MMGEVQLFFSEICEPSALGTHFSTSRVFFSMLPSSPFIQHFGLVTTYTNKDVGLCVRDSLKCFALRILKAPTNISWLWWTTFMVAFLKQVRYSLSDSEGSWRMLNKLVVDIFLCRLNVNQCTSFFTSFWQLAMEARSRSMYHP